MRRYFDLEWIAVRLNFFVGVLSLRHRDRSAGVGLCRAASFPSSLAASARAGHPTR